MLAGSTALMVDCLSLIRSVLSTETNTPYGKHIHYSLTGSVWWNCYSFSLGHNWIVYKNDFTEAFDVASCFYLGGAWGLVHLEHNA